MPDRRKPILRYAAAARLTADVERASSVLRGAAIGLPSRHFSRTELELLGSLLNQLDEACQQETEQALAEAEGGATP